MSNLKLLAETMRDYSDAAGDHHWQAAAAIEQLIAVNAQLELLKGAYKDLAYAIHDIDDVEYGSEEMVDAWPNLFSLIQQGFEVVQSTPTQCLAKGGAA